MPGRTERASGVSPAGVLVSHLGNRAREGRVSVISTNSKRRMIRHAAIGFSSLAGAGAIFYSLDSPQLTFKLSMATAYAGTVLIGLTLVLGPMNVLRKRPNPISYHLRRDVGIWAGIYSLAHVVAGLQVHLVGRMWLYFVYPAEESRMIPIRYDQFGVANHSGLFLTLVILLLLALSNDFALRRLSPGRWKAIHRWNYPGFAALAQHAALYQVIENRSIPIMTGQIVNMVIVVGCQVMGFRATRVRATRPGAVRSSR